MRTRERDQNTHAGRHPVVIVVSILGLAFSAAPIFMSLPSVDAAIMLVILPAVCCGGLLLTGRGIFAAFYIGIFLLARVPLVLAGGADFLTILFSLIVVFLFVWAAVEAYSTKN